VVVLRLVVVEQLLRDVDHGVVRPALLALRQRLRKHLSHVVLYLLRVFVVHQIGLQVDSYYFFVYYR